MTVTMAVTFIAILCSFIIVYHLYKIKGKLDEQFKDLRYNQNHANKTIEHFLYQINSIVSDIEDEIKKKESKL